MEVRAGEDYYNVIVAGSGNAGLPQQRLQKSMVLRECCLSTSAAPRSGLVGTHISRPERIALSLKTCKISLAS